MTPPDDRAETMSRWHDQPEVRALLTAIQFFSRIPVPGGKTRDLATFPQDIRRGLKYVPLIGAGISTITAIALILCAIVLPFPVAVIVALAVEALVTGAFHEDAVADFFDAFGGGWTRDDVLRILKDSRVGSFGSLGLLLAVALRASGLVTLGAPIVAGVALILAGTIGRLTILAVMALVPPIDAREGLSKDIAQQATWGTFALGALLASPVIAFGLWFDALGIAVAGVLIAVFVLWFRGYLMRRIGGVTGDCLGFSAYAGIIITTLALARH